MSETVHYKGTLTEVYRLENETLEEQCKRVLWVEEFNDDYYDSFQEMLLDQSYERYIVHNDILYSVTRQELNTEDSLFNMSKNEDGDFDFEVRYYNGGCGFDEAIERAFERKAMLKDIFGN